MPRAGGAALPRRRQRHGHAGDLRPTRATPAGRACASNLCQQAALQRSNIGCEYWGADLDNAVISATENAAAQQYAIVVSNAQPDVPAHVRVYQDDTSPGEVNAPT